MSRGNNKFNPWMNRNFQQNKQRPMYSMSANQNNQNNPNGNSSGSLGSDVYVAEQEPGAFIGWKLYFPNKAFKDSLELVRKVKTMQKHFMTFIHWYDLADIEENQMIKLKLENLNADPVLAEEWSDFHDDLKAKPTQTLALISLAMHNIIVEKMDEESSEFCQFQKIYTRPIGYDNQVSLDKLYLSAGQLVSVTGTVTRVEPSKFSRKITCFKCSMCAALIVVKQKPNSVIQTTPTSCHKGCPARSRFVELLTSPHTITQLKQVVTIRENLYDTDLNKVQNVTLIQDLVNTVIVGMSVTVTGIVKHEHAKPQKFVNPNECKKLKSYLKCFSVEQRHKVSPMSEVSITDQRDVLQMMKAEPSPFRVLVHSLCPSIYGREEVKAGLILALLSGNELMPYRRSESHVLLVGIPGAGKSKLLQFCAEVSTKGMFVSGPTSTGVGLLANVGKKGTVDAGPLVLADGGVCCIDEFDKMASHSHVLLESMEQQVVSIMKCGVLVNMPSRVSIIAAANPVTSFYDRKKTMLQNVKIKTPLMSRFDLIFALETNSRESDDQFLAHINSKDSSAGSSSFFSSSNFSPMTTGKKTGTSWIKQNYKEPVNTLSLPLLKFFIGYARENIKPTLSLEAKVAIKTFYLEMQQANVGPEVQVVTFRQLEALMRLTLARARADLAEIATREHALEVISIMKHSMIDIYPDDDPLDATVSSSGATKRRAENLSSLSKPKQMKAFKEHLENEVELQNRDEFSKAEIKNMAKELGIKDVNEIIDRFNYAQFLLILNTGNGYKVNLHGHLL